MSEYYLGQTVTLRATITDADGTLTNATVTATAKKPDRSTASLSASNVSTGVYDVEVALIQPGDWYYRIVASGALAAAKEGRLTVRKSNVA